MAGFNPQAFSEEVRNILKDYSEAYQVVGEQLIQLILQRVQAGAMVSAAVRDALQETGFQAAYNAAVQDAVLCAACAGYGVLPRMLTEASRDMIIEKLLSDSWAEDNVRLSRRLHTLDVEKKVVQAIQAAMRNAQTVREEARALYDGYASGGGVLDQAKLPQELRRIERMARQALNGDRESLRKIQKAAEKLRREAGKLESPGMKAAYLAFADVCGTDLETVALDRAVHTAVEERTRYHAERIARTEAARAWFDGHLAKTLDDADVWGYRWVLSSRHGLVPFDQCDVCANMDVGYGKGVYPKGKVPSIPRHPHCMCSLVDVITGETKGQGAAIRPEGARKYIDSLTDHQQMNLFGAEGKTAYKDGGDWQELLRGWRGFEMPRSRLRKSDFQLKDNAKAVTLKTDNQKVVEEVQYVGKIDRKLYQGITPDIRTDEVIITERQIEHIQERHPGDFEKYKQFFKEAIQDPDYILKANKENTALILKEINIDGEGVKLVLRLQTSTDPVGYKNSIITFQKINAKRYTRYVKNAEILYAKS